MYNMRKLIIFILMIMPLCVLAQKVRLGVSKDLGWAVWTYDTIEFRDDCTILKGYFVSGANGCWVISNMDETLEADGRSYRIIYTTLPTKRHPRTTYKGGVKVNFEERFEPIFSTGGTVQLPTHNISFSIPFKERKATKPIEELFTAYEAHIDTLISKGKHNIAAYLLNQYARKVWLSVSENAKKEISNRLFLKYRVLDFFLNASSDYDYILAQFEHAYNLLNYKGDSEVLKRLDYITRLQGNIELNINGKHPSKVVEWCETLLPLVKKVGIYSKIYENSLTLYRKALVLDGQLHRIPDLDNEIIDVCRHVYTNKEGEYLDRLMNIGSNLDILPSKKSYPTYISINIWKEVRDKAWQSFPNSWRYASALQEIAYYNSYYHHYAVALKQYLTIDSLYKVKRNEWMYEVWYNHDYFSFKDAELYIKLVQESLSKSIAYCYSQIGDMANAIKYYGTNPYYHYALGNTETVMDLCNEMYKESISGLKGVIRKPTIISPGAYYEEVFDNVYSPALTAHIPYFAYKTKSGELCEKTYDGALITKEFRLSAGKRLREYLSKTQDSVSLSYKDRINKEMGTYQTMIKKGDLKSVNKHWEIVKLQRNLISHLDSIGALDTFFPNWTDVRNVLREDELAIEFIKIPMMEKNKSLYAALTLRKGYEHPKIIELFDEEQLKLVSDTLYYQCKEMADLVWGPLMSELMGIKNIYFSPISALYNIGVEYLSGMENYNIYRLSSTRELLTDNIPNPNNHAVLFGGLDYYSKLGTLSHGIAITPAHKAFASTDVRDMKIRGGKEYLPQTKNEIEQIEKVLRGVNWSCMLDSASVGTEESFKSLSGDSICLLHIATHGFYYTPEEIDSMSYDFIQIDKYVATAEDKSLSRSGLLMSGANHILEGENIPDNVEDGILTAKEISGVDLQGLDLVVLSACQTGLGDISQGEGVFGLQRGFKKAGANSILMSLWEVNDEATQILMTQFYKNLVSGRSKRQSLQSAQRYLREYNAGQYNKPEYWAAFILLDGIDKN